MPATRTRTNRYPGRCCRCGSEVAAEAGEMARSDGRWLVWHRDGECVPMAPAPAPVATPPLGIHYLPATETVIRVRLSRQGRAYAQTMNRTVLTETGRATWDYAGRRPFATLSADTLVDEETARKIGGTLRFCVNCGRGLRVRESVERGIGPVCWRRIRANHAAAHETLADVYVAEAAEINDDNSDPDDDAEQARIRPSASGHMPTTYCDPQGEYRPVPTREQWFDMTNAMDREELDAFEAATGLTLADCR